MKLPEDIGAVVKIDKPYTVRDDNGYGAAYKAVCRLKFKNGSWSDITEIEYKIFKSYYWESGGKLELP